jgi:hypothetical protein
MEAVGARFPWLVRVGAGRILNEIFFKLSAMIISDMADRKIIDDSHSITQKRGNGQLRREVWVDAHGDVTRYNLAYINHALHGTDNGRVVGCDNQHGYHHRHYFGLVSPVIFISFEDIEDQFQADWSALRSPT